MEEIRTVKKRLSYKKIIVAVGILVYIFGIAIGIGLVINKIILPELKPISIETVKDSVVMIKTYDEYNQEYGQGSGFCFKENNNIVTNFHVIEGAKRIEILTDDGQTYNIKNILIFDKKNDVALIEGDFILKPVAYISAFNMSKKDSIATISSPAGAFNTISEGTISEVYQNSTEMLAPIKPGSSGGAVINQKGRVFAIIVANLNPDTNENLAININIAESLYNKYKNDKFAIIENKPEDINSFLPNIFDDKDGSELNIMNKWNKNKKIVYQPESLITFNNLTSSYNIFTQAITKKNDSFSEIYLDLAPGKKISAVNYYQYLKAYDLWWFSKDNIEFDETENLRKDIIKDWSDEQVLLDLGVLERYQLSILGAITEDLIYYEEFLATVKKLPIDEGRKGILLLTLGGDKPTDLTNKQNTVIKTYINTSIKDKKVNIKEVLERLGY